MIGIIFLFQLLIGFDSGQVVLWDVKNRMVDMRWSTGELRSIAWHHEGKQFMCSHADGTLTTWSLKSSAKYIYISQPHGKCFESLIFTFNELNCRY